MGHEKLQLEPLQETVSGKDFMEISMVCAFYYRVLLLEVIWLLSPTAQLNRVSSLQSRIVSLIKIATNTMDNFTLKSVADGAMACGCWSRAYDRYARDASNVGACGKVFREERTVLI